MEKKPITVIAKVTAREGFEKELENLLTGLIGPSRADEGCNTYILHRDPENSGNFMFYEVWSSREALDKHLAQPHLKDFLRQSEKLLAEPLDVSLWQRID